MLEISKHFLVVINLHPCLLDTTYWYCRLYKCIIINIKFMVFKIMLISVCKQLGVFMFINESKPLLTVWISQSSHFWSCQLYRLDKSVWNSADIRCTLSFLANEGATFMKIISCSYRHTTVRGKKCFWSQENETIPKQIICQRDQNR